MTVFGDLVCSIEYLRELLLFYRFVNCCFQLSDFLVHLRANS